MSIFTYILIGWVNAIVFKEKEQLIATLLLDEIIWKRDAAINKLIQGLTLLNVIDVVWGYPNQFLKKFVHSNVLLTGKKLETRIMFKDPSNNAENRAKTLFLNYIHEDLSIPCGEGTISFRKIMKLLYNQSLNHFKIDSCRTKNRE